MSHLKLTALYWSPPKLIESLPNNTITVHDGNMITTTFMLLKDASLNDSGNCTLTAVNVCGQRSLKIDVDVAGNIIVIAIQI